MICRFQELKNKEVINVKDGKRLGFVCDIEISSQDGKILSLILPPQKSRLFFAGDDDITVEWDKIKKIGDDIILVDLICEKD